MQFLLTDDWFHMIITFGVRHVDGYFNKTMTAEIISQGIFLDFLVFFSQIIW